MLIATLVLYVSMLFGGSSAAAVGPVLADLEKARDRAPQVADSKEQRRAIEGHIDAVLAASRSRDDEIDARAADLRRVFSRHDATLDELRSALDAIRQSLDAELEATLEAYFELRAALTPEQWAALFPAPGAAPSPESTPTDDNR